jgi:acyl-CoA synthetase (AMP-forming)/AMP-acid ligase II
MGNRRWELQVELKLHLPIRRSVTGLDRLKDMIVTGGENVYSGEVEAVIYEHASVREAAVFGIPDPQ